MRHDFGNSGALRAAELDPSTGVVAVEFTGGQTRKFGGFTAEEFAEWGRSDKPGKWFSDRVRSRPKVHPEVSSSAPTDQVEPPIRKEEAAADGPSAPMRVERTDPAEPERPAPRGARAKARAALDRWNGRTPKQD